MDVGWAEGVSGGGGGQIKCMDRAFDTHELLASGTPHPGKGLRPYSTSQITILLIFKPVSGMK